MLWSGRVEVIRPRLSQMGLESRSRLERRFRRSVLFRAKLFLLAAAYSTSVLSRRLGTPRGSEAVQRAVRPHVDPSIDERGRCVDLVADFVDREHLPLRTSLENGDLAFGTGEEHFAVRGNR